MLDPFSLLPLALAAHGGRVDDFEAQQLVAAGLTLLQRNAALVRALSGKRAGVLLPTSPVFLTALAASEGRGAVLMNPAAAPPELAHQISDADVGAVFTTSSLADQLPPGTPVVLLDDAPRTARVIIAGVSKDVDLGSHVGLNVEGDSDAPGHDDEAVVVYTSAMAGTPLGAILTHRNLLANARSTIAACPLDAGDVVLAALPFAHLFGLTVSLSAPLLAGARVMTMPRFSPARVAELLASGEVTMFVGVPAMFQALLATFEHREDANVGALRVCICGGAPLGETLQRRWLDVTGVDLRQGYGLTEAGPVCLFNRTDGPNVIGTLGDPFPGVDVELRSPIAYDDDGRPIPDSVTEHAPEIGEICVRGENVFRGYVSRGELGLPVLDGWLHTGDIGRRDADGRLGFAGVAKPMFTRNGFNIYPRELERVVSGLRGVSGVHVSMAPAGDGREPDIVLDVQGAVTVEDVKRWCAERLSAYKQPTVINIRE